MRASRGGRDEDPHHRPGGAAAGAITQSGRPGPVSLVIGRRSGGLVAGGPPSGLGPAAARLLLLDLTGLSFCDARGLSAFVRIANHADAAGCRFGLIAPRPPVAKILRISGLDSRMPVFAIIDVALAILTAAACA